MPETGKIEDGLEQDVVDAGYPVEELDELIDLSQEEFRQSLTEFGPGQNWVEGDARDFRADVEWNLQDAIDAAEYGRFETANKHLGDAVNYLLFLKAVIDRQEREATASESEVEA